MAAPMPLVQALRPAQEVDHLSNVVGVEKARISFNRKFGGVEQETPDTVGTLLPQPRRKSFNKPAGDFRLISPSLSPVHSRSPSVGSVSSGTPSSVAANMLANSELTESIVAEDDLFSLTAANEHKKRVMESRASPENVGAMDWTSDASPVTVADSEASVVGSPAASTTSPGLSRAGSFQVARIPNLDTAGYTPEWFSRMQEERKAELAKKNGLEVSSFIEPREKMEKVVIPKKSVNVRIVDEPEVCTAPTTKKIVPTVKKEPGFSVLLDMDGDRSLENFFVPLKEPPQSTLRKWVVPYGAFSKAKKISAVVKFSGCVDGRMFTVHIKGEKNAWVKLACPKQLVDKKTVRMDCPVPGQNFVLRMSWEKIGSVVVIMAPRIAVG